MKKITLSQGKFAIVDNADYHLVSKHKWYARKIGKSFYAGRTSYKRGKKTNVHIHRVIMKTPIGFDTDHLNGNGLDNRRKNLRICSHAKNMSNRPKKNKNNTSGSSGVYWNKSAKKWQAQVSRKGRFFYLGVFSSKRKATIIRKNFIKQESS